MKRYLIPAVAIAMLLANTHTAFGQFPYVRGVGSTAGRPTFSPYLNLLRRGNSRAFNYFSLVRPEMRFRNKIQQFQSQFNSVEQGIQTLDKRTGLPPTGHAVGFMTHMRYFNTLGNSSSPGGVGGSGTIQRRGSSTIQPNFGLRR